jgi:hypothetical protein
MDAKTLYCRQWFSNRRAVPTPGTLTGNGHTTSVSRLAADLVVLSASPASSRPRFLPIGNYMLEL